MKSATGRNAESVAILRTLPFVRDLRYISSPNKKRHGHDEKLSVQTSRGRFQLIVEEKRSFLTQAAVNQFLAWAKTTKGGKPRQFILLARHIPRTIAQRLLAENVNFADDAGNVHLRLGDRYSWTSIGTPAPKPASDVRPLSAASVQLLFQFVTYPESANWPVRSLEMAAGISKSKAAQVRGQLLAEGLLVRKGKGYQLGPKDLVAERLSAGYTQVLRPKILLGRFRHAEKTKESFLTRVKASIPSGFRYALTGGSGASVLQRFYNAPEVSLFIEPSGRKAAQELRLLPDREGPVFLLRAFGELVFWQKRDGYIVAPPWLIYAELLSIDDARAHEAAREFRKQLLT